MAVASRRAGRICRGVPIPLFQTHAIAGTTTIGFGSVGRMYDATPDGQRFVCQCERRQRGAADRRPQLASTSEAMTLVAGVTSGPLRDPCSPVVRVEWVRSIAPRDTNLGRDVAIKILPEAFAHDPDRLARFQREAEDIGVVEPSKHRRDLRVGKAGRHSCAGDGTRRGTNAR